MFYIFSQDKKVVTPFGEDKNSRLKIDLSTEKIKLLLESITLIMTLGEFETKQQCTVCIRTILNKYTECNGNGYYEINSAKYYNY